MQTIAHTPANAQHIPDGWSFPTLTAAVPPNPGPAAPVVGGGATASTVTRVRWGRLLPVMAGIALLAFGIWNVTSDSTSTKSRSNSGTVSGGGTDGVDISRSTGNDDAIDDIAANDAGAAGQPEAMTPATPPVAAPPRAAAPRTAATNRAAANRRAAVARRARARRAAAAAAAIPAANIANAAPRTATGGGAGPNGELPMTGLETWIAAFLGALLLGIGICVHVNAVRIGMTALLYRRGILLRPVDCARLAQERGLPRARVWISNVLHRLLEEPAGGRDFVAARHAL